MSEFIPDLVKEATEEFNNHLALPNNSRIIFSGRYGLGKTRFLKHYFENKKDKFYTIRLAPVNYSIASNEDIFKYIKYDILRALISDRVLKLKELDFSKWEVLPFFLKKHFKDIVKGTLRGVSKLGPSEENGIGVIYEELDGLYSKLESFQKKSNKGDKKRVEGFTGLLEEEEGSLYEYNVITELITEGLGNLREKKNVLIIDDLDRIDPEHIFRLFNVFAAHIDFKGDEGDKFGFDKVIFVCDVENIQSIFHHRYGSRTDFSGYIDKFYSTRVFYFNNKNDLRRILKEYIGTIDFTQSRRNWKEGAQGRIMDELFFIIDSFIINNSYNLRNLYQKSTDHRIADRKIVLKNRSERNFISLVSGVVIEILLTIFGDKGTLKKHLEKCFNKNETVSQFLDRRLSHVLLLYFIEDHQLTDSNFKLQKYGLTMDFKIETTDIAGIKYAKLEKEEAYRNSSGAFNDDFKENMNLFKLYQGCIDMLEQKGMI